MTAKSGPDPVIWTPETMGRKGGSRKVPKGLAKFSKKKRREIAMLSVAARQRKKQTDAGTAPDARRGRRKAAHVAAHAGRVEVA